jgi:hypothetical protein
MLRFRTELSPNAVSRPNYVSATLTTFLEVSEA